MNNNNNDRNNNHRTKNNNKKKTKKKKKVRVACYMAYQESKWIQTANKEKK